MTVRILFVALLGENFRFPAKATKRHRARTCEYLTVEPLDY